MRLSCRKDGPRYNKLPNCVAIVSDLATKDLVNHANVGRPFPDALVLLGKAYQPFPSEDTKAVNCVSLSDSSQIREINQRSNSPYHRRLSLLLFNLSFV